MDETLKLAFDVKTADLLVCNGHVVMSRSEAPYIRQLVAQFAGMPVRRVLEVGFGLGISAAEIQAQLQQLQQHDIIEIEQSLYQDCCRFCRQQPTARAIGGDFYSYPFADRYDLLFFDPYDYDYAAGRISREQSIARELNLELMRAHQLLLPGGMLCHLFFGTAPMPELEGFRLAHQGFYDGPAFSLNDGTDCRTAHLAYYVKQ